MFTGNSYRYDYRRCVLVPGGSWGQRCHLLIFRTPRADGDSFSFLSWPSSVQSCPRDAAVVIGLADTRALSGGVQDYINSSNIAVLWTSLLFGLR